MSIYVGDCELFGGSLYEVSEQPKIEPESSKTEPATQRGTDALIKAAELVAGGPETLLPQVLTSDPSRSKLPIGIAALGGLVVAAIWANSLGKRQ